MDVELIKIIKSQTNVDDDAEIEKAYSSCDQDVSKTILKLSNIDVPQEPERHTSEHTATFNELRHILDQKAYVFQNLFTKQ